jgi:hypothetical protein
MHPQFGSSESCAGYPFPSSSVVVPIAKSAACKQLSGDMHVLRVPSLSSSALLTSAALASDSYTDTNLPVNMRASAPLVLTLSITLVCSYRLASILDISLSALPEPWRTFSLLLLLGPAWFALASSFLALAPATPKEAKKHWLVLLNTT